MNDNKTVETLTEAQQIAGHVCRILMDGIRTAPEFPEGSVPIAIAAQVYGKDATWVRAGIIAGWLPIGRATRNGEIITDISQMDSRYGKINYYISPKKLWEDTGHIWKV